MLVKVYGAAVQGIDATIVTIEVNSSRGIKFFLVGLPDSAVKESHERIISALQVNGYKFPTCQIVVNMAPADIRKEGSAYDLPLAIGILAATQIVSEEKLSRYLIIGELSLDGSLQPVKGALSIAISAREQGFEGFILPKQNAREAAVVNNLKVYGVENIKEVIEFFNNERNLEPSIVNTREEFYEHQSSFPYDFADVKGQESVKRALEVEEINKLLNEVPLKKLPEDLIRCRVWANLMFQLRGMPFVDLAHLHKSDLKGNTLSYRRYKTGGQMIVDIPITAMKLINKYQNTNQDSPYLFPILSGTKTGEDLYTEYQQALRTMNYNLGRLAKKCGVATKVSSYTTRHTWATLAKYCNFSEQLICEAFGHSSVKVTETYLKNFKYEEIKKANDAIILYVSKNGKKRA